MDLFKAIVALDRLHPNFLALTSEFGTAERFVLNDWARGFKDRDGKFVKEFQTTFNACFWELYLNSAFRELGLSSDFNYSSPDFVVSLDSKVEFIAEAVTANHPDGFRPEWDGKNCFEQYTAQDSHAIVDLATIRLAGAIVSKHAKYIKSYEKLDHVADKPFVICVAPFEQPLFFVQNDNAIRRVLYGYDGPLLIPGADGSKLHVGEAGIEKIVKDSGAEIPLGLFQAEMMPEVSAVIFSNTATMTKVHALANASNVERLFFARRYQESAATPYEICCRQVDYEESILDGLHLFLNPYAKNPLDSRLFRNHEIAVHSLNDSGDYEIEVTDGFLYQHSCMTFTHGETAAGLKQASNQYKSTSRPLWTEADLHPVPGQVLSFVDNHLARYKDWTILVARDEADNDWGAQAARGSAQTIAAYHRLNKVDMILLERFYSAKELALQEVISEINRLSA